MVNTENEGQMTIEGLAFRMKSIGMNCPIDILSSWAIKKRVSEEFLADLNDLVSMAQARIDENKKEMIRTMSHIPQVAPKTFDSFLMDCVTGDVSKMIAHLKTLSFIEQGMNVIMIGDQGTGKTHIAQAIGNECCNRMIRVRYFKMQEMKTKIRNAIDNDRASILVQNLVSLPCLIIDEIGFCSLAADESSIFFQIVDERYDKGKKSMVFTSNKKPSEWRQVFSDGMLAKCILDRIFDKCIQISMKGESFRGKEQIGYKLNFGSSTEITGLV